MFRSGQHSATAKWPADDPQPDGGVSEFQGMRRRWPWWQFRTGEVCEMELAAAD